MKIVEVEEKDFSEVISLIKEEFPYASFDEAKIRKRLESKRIFIYKAVEGKSLLGFVEVELLEESIARINGLTVKQEFRNRGIAKELLDFVIDFLKKKKVERVLLLVKQKNDAAKTIYEKAGFSFIGMYHREVDNAVVEEMELDISAGKKDSLSYVG